MDVRPITHGRIARIVTRSQIVFGKSPKQNWPSNRDRWHLPTPRADAGNHFIPRHVGGDGRGNHGIQTKLQSPASRTRSREAGQKGSEIAGTRRRRSEPPQIRGGRWRAIGPECRRNARVVKSARSNYETKSIAG